MKHRFLKNSILSVSCLLSLAFLYNNCSRFEPASNTALSHLGHDHSGHEHHPPMPPQVIPKVGDFPKFPSEFNVKEFLWGTKGQNIPEYNTIDVVGAFRFECNFSHLGYDDPIVYPGMPGASHLHMFFGNTETDAYSTYESLRKSGDGSCHGGPLNRSAYWIPAMLNGKGKVVVPDLMVIYYKGNPSEEMQNQFLKPEQKSTPASILPRGMRYIFGFDMGNPKPYDAYSPYGWKCENRGEFHGTIQGVADSGCEGGEGARLIGFVNAPACWDGVHLDSADHRSHVVHRILKNDVGWVCPDTHQHTIPTFSLGIYFDHNGPDDLRTWHLSSDGMTNPQAGGSTLHADWFGAWDDDILETWHNEVILGYRTTAGGGLGDGRGLVASPNFFSHKDGRLIDIPPRPTK